MPIKNIRNMGYSWIQSLASLEHVLIPEDQILSVGKDDVLVH